MSYIPWNTLKQLREEHYDKPLDPERLDEYRALIRRLLDGCAAAHEHAMRNDDFESLRGGR